ncbi:DUF1257 domain-containing protein [Actinomadura sp. NPDC047616]|uniref:DUF1257 domain-containing protein n=1 Tax=Actinomadura sp. NPDC047616 TaxID=3155914 RepID=UPI0033EBCC65
MVDGQVLRRALEKMGYRVEPAGQGVRGYGGQRSAAEFKIQPAGSAHEIGFVSSGQGYVIVADWWGIRGLEQAAFTRTVNQQYALVSTLSALEARGFEVDAQTTGESGEIRVVLRRTAGM